MELAYFAAFRLRSGVAKKIQSQVRTWKSLGHDVKVYQLTPNSQPVPEDLRSHWSSFQYGSKISRVFAGLCAYQSILRQNPDALYQRNFTYYPSYEYVKRRLPVIIEVNSDDFAESHAGHGNIGYNWYNRLTRGRVLGSVDGAVFVTDELMKNDSFSKYDFSYEVIGNGINLSNYSTLPQSSPEETRLAFLAAKNQPWHGMDKILDLAKNKPDWGIDIIGLDESSFKYSPDNVEFYGYLDEYEDILSKADVAIGSLSFYEKNMYQACPLKIREYLAYGLPAIVGHDDVDLPASSPFLLTLPNEPYDIGEHLEAIEDFVSEWKGKRVQHSAITSLDIESKEQERLAYIEDVVES